MIADYSISIGEKIRFLRLSRNLTQDELAANIGITGRKVSDYENGTAVPDSKTIETFSAFFKCEFSFFVSDGCFREEQCSLSGDFMLDVYEGDADENGEFKCVECVMADRRLCRGRKTFIWRVNNEFSKEYGDEEGTSYLVSLTTELAFGDKILVVSGGKTYIARYECTDGKKYITECKGNAKRIALKKGDTVCGLIRGRIEFK